MKDSKCAKPATWQGEPASNVEQLGRALDVLHTPTVVTAQLIGSDRVVVDDIEARTALDLCRALIEAGANPDATLVCYRGNHVSLSIRTIGEGARLAIREDGLRVVPWKAFSRRDVAAPMRQKGEVVS